MLFLNSVPNLTIHELFVVFLYVGLPISREIFVTVKATKETAILVPHSIATVTRVDLSERTLV